MVLSSMSRRRAATADDIQCSRTPRLWRRRAHCAPLPPPQCKSGSSAQHARANSPNSPTRLQHHTNIQTQYNPSDRRHKPAQYKELPPPPPEVIVVSAAASK